MARKPTRQELNALDAAQQVIYTAWESARARRLKLAEKALALSPLCADAHAMFAEAAADTATALPHWRAAVAAGEAAIGTAGFKAMEGEFWGWLETRPYMRALGGLAASLVKAGEIEEAIAIGHRMLVLNPNDNQGIRYELMGWIMRAGQDGDAAALIAQYPDDGMAIWPWTQALLLFRAEGGSPAATAALRAVIEANVHVAPLLTGRKRMLKRSAPFYGWGEPSEAQRWWSRRSAQPGRQPRAPWRGSTLRRPRRGAGSHRRNSERGRMTGSGWHGN